MGIKRVLTPREELQREIAILTARQDQRLEYVELLKRLYDERQLEIDNLTMRLDQLDEQGFPKEAADE